MNLDALSLKMCDGQWVKNKNLNNFGVEMRNANFRVETEEKQEKA